MKYDFAALSFPADENLAGRLYWYLCAFPVAAGEEVLAPIGPHDRLQLAIAERTLCAEEEEAPYDLRFIKRIAARYGDRRVGPSGKFLEFGGVRYDEKHYTRFGRLFLARGAFSEEEAKALGIGTCYTGEACGDFYERLAAERAPMLVSGEDGEKIFKSLYAHLRGDGEALQRFGVSERTAAKLEEKLG